MKSNWKTGWKLLWCNKSDKTCWSFCHTSYGAVQYTKGKITSRQPGCGPLSVFPDYDSALAFFCDDCFGGETHAYSVAKCKYVPSKDRKLWCVHNDTTFEMRWKVPPNTVFAEKIKITSDPVTVSSQKEFVQELWREQK